ncbi:MAG: tetratricopeptide repeat protein [Neomegalonema sp.]|nr:tetratricopeptide repeat protein [Neomegalonema sp.]
MLKLIIKILLAMAAVAAAVWAILWWQGIEGVTTLEFGGNTLTTETKNVVIGVPLIFGVLWFVIALVRGTLGSFSALFGFVRRRRHERGLDALSKTLIAIAEEDGKKAMKLAMKAERLLDNPDLTRLVNAQAATMAGDRLRAEKYFELMSTDPDTNYLGVRGLLQQALEDKKNERALRLAEQAHDMRPKAPEVLDIMFDLQRKKGDWAGARQTIEAGVRARRLTRDVGDRRRAVLYLTDAMQKQKEGDMKGAYTEAREAARLSPALAPAAVLSARLLTQNGDPREASRALIRAWKQSPHPSIAAGFAALAPHEEPAARLKRFERLIGANPMHAESKLLKAELAIAAGQLTVARDALGDLPETEPTARACALMAAIEQGQAGGEAAVRGWLSKAAAAPRGAQWVCDNCGHIAAEWTHSCGSCNAFDTLSWKQIEGPQALEDAALFPLLAQDDQPAPIAPAAGAVAVAVSDSEDEPKVIEPARQGEIIPAS